MIGIATELKALDQTVSQLSDCFRGTYRGKRVLVTGHTGFKGSWLCEWLLALGAEVSGCSLPPPTDPSLFEQLNLRDRLSHTIGDVRKLDTVRDLIQVTKPDFVFHLAAQPLVRASYIEPVATYATNVMGTAHVLEAVRISNHPCTVIGVSSDKCYENQESTLGYREADPMGGYDPYSSSKGAAELLMAAYRRSYFSVPPSNVRLASVRSGNVIGGGDWAVDRIVPDCVRALQQGAPIFIRNPRSTRPWQHVLEPLSGYLWLAAMLHNPDCRPAQALTSSPLNLDSAFNFGPSPAANRTVGELVEEILQHWPGCWEDKSTPGALHEATHLSLATDKAHQLLGWKPVWSFSETIAETVKWYRTVNSSPIAMAEFTRSQIAGYVSQARHLQLPWAR